MTSSSSLSEDSEGVVYTRGVGTEEEVSSNVSFVTDVSSIEDTEELKALQMTSEKFLEKAKEIKGMIEASTHDDDLTRTHLGNLLTMSL